MNDVAVRLKGLSEQKQKLLQRLVPDSAKPADPDRLAPRPAGATALPLTHAQRGLWFLSRLAPDSSFYHMPYAVHLTGRLDIAALTAAFNALIQRHEALRTTFPESGGKPVQRIAPRLTLTVPLVDLAGLPEAEREPEAVRRASEDSLRPFDLAEGPLLRAALYRLGENGLGENGLDENGLGEDGPGEDAHLLMFSMHHIISDGWSVGVMMQEIAVLYEAFRHGLRPFDLAEGPLPALRLQYADYALWQEKCIQAGALDGQLEYWRDKLAGTVPLNLPTDHPRPAVQRYRGATRPLRIPEPVTAALEDLGRREGTTLFTVLLAAFQAVLFLAGGTRRVVVGTPVANRKPRETEPLIGFFANTLALSTDCSGDPSFLALLARAKDTTLGAFAHQDVPFELLVEAVQAERDPSRNPLFQVMFGLQSVSVREFGLPGLTASPRALDNDTTHFDLELQLWHHQTHLGGYFSYNLELFAPDTIARLEAHLLALLDAAAADPGASLSALAATAGIPPLEMAPCARAEAALLAHPAVEDCAVVARERGQSVEMAAYVVPSPPFDAEAVRRSLPPPLTPAVVVPVSAIPRTAEGAVDETALRALPVIDATVIEWWEWSLAKLNGTGPVRVTVEEARRRPSWLHFADLLALDGAAGQTCPLPPAGEGGDPRSGEGEGGPTVPFSPAFGRKRHPHPYPLPPAGEGESRPAFSDGGPLHLPADAPRTLGEALVRTAASQAERGIVFVQEGTDRTVVSYADLLREARRRLAGMQARGLKPGDRVILQLHSLPDHFSTFWACVLGGIVPVTVALPPTYQEKGGVVNKLWNVWTLLHHPVILTNAALAPRLAGVPELYRRAECLTHARTVAPVSRGHCGRGQARSAPGEGMDEPLGSSELYDAGATEAFQVWAVEELQGDPEAARPHAADPEDVVFLQLTSGSTGIPKCVQETHRAIVHHIHGSCRFNDVGRDAVSLNWLPLDHVVPILTCHLRDTYLGLRQIQAATTVVLTDPLTWLDLIEAHRVTHTWAPNFGFKLVSDRLARTRGRRWDLSSVRAFMNAGEQVTLPVVREFLDLLAPFGVGPQAMQPAFGMAEASTCMTYHNGLDEGTGVHRVLKASLNGVLRMAPAGTEDACVTFVDLGPPMPGVQIRIADTANRVLPERMIGRLQIRGPVVMPGYLDNPQANRDAFVGDGWFDSGDLGFLCDGRLTLTGRAKETIIIRGANFYCYEIEEVVNGVDGVLPTFSAACAVQVPHKGTEGLAVFFVPRSGALPADPAVTQRIRDQVSRQLGISPDFVVPLAQADFPKTTSGKIQRTHLKQALEDGRFAATLKAIDLAEENANCLPDWFFRRAWQVLPLRRALHTPTAGVSVIFADAAGGVADHLLEPDAIRVEPGDHFARLERGHYRLDPHRAEDYAALLEAVAADGLRIGRIIHLWSYASPSGPLPLAGEGVHGWAEAQARGSLGVLFLAQALARLPEPPRGLAVLVCSSGVQAVEDDDRLDCRHAPLLGLLRSLAREMPGLSCRHIDLPAGDHAANAERIADEAAAADKEAEVAYRHGVRRVPILERADLGSRRPLPLRRGGLYFLSGGLGGVGRLLARALLTHWQARLVLIGRSPAERHAEALADLQRLGGSVRYVSADVADAAELRAALADTPPPDGIFHMAGEFHTRSLAEETADSFIAALRPRLAGSRALHDLAPPDALFVHVASVNGVFGGAMAGAYSAANSISSAVSHWQRQQGGLRSQCLSFSLWDEVGMSRGYHLKEQSRAQGYLPIDATRGINSLLIGLASDQPHLLIGLDGDRPNIRRHLRRDCRPLTGLRAHVVGLEDGTVPSLPAERIADRYGTPCPCDLVPVDHLPPEGGRVPSTGPVSATPATDLQRTIAAVWQEVLGLASVGIHQSFFEIGGQSLALVQVHSRLQDVLNREIQVVDLLQYPTVATLAAFLGETPSRTASYGEAVERAKRQQASRQRRKPVLRV